MPSIDLRLLLTRTLTANANAPVTSDSAANTNEPTATEDEPAAPPGTAPRKLAPPRRVRESPPRPSARVPTQRALRPRRRS